MKQVIVTTSWDDGHKLDLKLAALLKKYGIKGTFYVCPKDREIPADQMLTDHEVRQLSKDFEIGAHTVTHPHLDRLSVNEAKKEIVDSKRHLEAVIGKPVTSFCYPYGDFSHETKCLVEAAGFKRARTVERFAARSIDRFAMRTSVDTFDHPRAGLMKVLKLCGRRPWRVIKLWRWDALALEIFEQTRRQGGVFHLWGHSHEIEAHKDWERLERILAYLAAQKDVRFVTNADVPIDPPKALITTPYFVPHTGGLEKYVYQITGGLNHYFGWDVVVATSGDDPKPTRQQLEGITLYHLPRRAVFSNTPIGKHWPRTLRYIIAQESPDIVVAHAPVPGMLDATVRATKKLPLVITYHMGSMKKGRKLVDLLLGAYETLLLSWYFRVARTLIGTSPFVINTFLKKYANKSQVVTPGVDTAIFAPARQPSSSQQIMHIGGLKPGEEHKGLRTSLEAVALLAKDYPSIRLQVIGNGDIAFYEDVARQLGIAKLVSFRGRLAGEPLAEAFRSSAIFVSPSSKESFGIALAEAMACGLPVIAGNVEGVPYIVKDGENGFLVPPHNPVALAAKIRMIFDDRKKAARIGKKARATIEERYLWPDKVDQTHHVLLAALKIEPSWIRPVPVRATIFQEYTS